MSSILRNILKKAFGESRQFLQRAQEETREMEIPGQRVGGPIVLTFSGDEIILPIGVEEFFNLVWRMGTECLRQKKG
jgi:DNA-binding protein YbaB